MKVGPVYQEEDTVVGLFDKQVKRCPGNVAIRWDDAMLSYSELKRRALQRAFFLKQKGVIRGEIVGIPAERTADTVVSILAVLMHGCSYLPLDASCSADRLEFMLKDSRARYVIAGKGFEEKGLQWPGDFLFPDYEEMKMGDPQGYERENDVDGRHAMHTTYASVSSDLPRGVVVSQQGLLRRLYREWDLYPYQEGEVCCQKTDLGFAEHAYELFSPLLKGIPLVIFHDGAMKDMEEMLRLLVSHRVSRITVMPYLLQCLIREKKRSNISLDSLKYIFCKGGALHSCLARDFYREFSQTRLINIYCSAETDVKDVLTYFTCYSLAGHTALETFTTPDTGIEEVKMKFMDTTMPVYPVALEEYYDRLYEDVIPYTINTASPAFIGHMTSALPDYVHDLSGLISRLNQNLVKIETSKSFTFLEREAIAILHRMFYDQPDSFYEEHVQKLNANLGIITSGGSTANLSALLSARNKLLYGPAAAQRADASIYSLLQEYGYKDMVVMGTELMHYSFRKALSVMGLGAQNIIYIKNDAQGGMKIQDLEEKISVCIEAKLLILAIIGIAGSTERGSIDPLVEMGQVARQHKIHFHVDAAWGGALIFSEEYRGLINGIEKADSITFCGHKQLFLPQGISLCLFKDPGQLNYNSVTANYQAKADSFDSGRFTIEGSRPALSMCLHASLNVIGKKGYELLIDHSIEKAGAFARMIRQTEGMELLSIQINILNYRYIPISFRQYEESALTSEMNVRINAVNTEIQQHQFYKGRTFVSKTTIKHRKYGEIVVFRAVISNPLTTHDDLSNVLKDQLYIIKELYGELNEINIQ